MKWFCYHASSKRYMMYILRKKGEILKCNNNSVDTTKSQLSHHEVISFHLKSKSNHVKDNAGRITCCSFVRISVKALISYLVQKYENIKDTDMEIEYMIKIQI